MIKSPDAFRTISEVAEELDLPQHVLRFWETRFSQIRPLKRGGGRRYYRPEDVDLLKGIKRLLYDEGYTIRGLQRILKEQGNRFVVAVGAGEIEAAAAELPPTTAVGLVQTAAAAPEPRHPEEPARKAVAVAELTAREKPKRLIDRLVGREAGHGATAGNPALSADDRRSLQATLYELLECKRLLDQVRGN
ncbi:MAG: MerR family transcriptional regulator [Alphaproteobacteria bacterium]|nr:MAG: MerR family transcriptional regulator [Alphaproteobacteria bacterium]